MPWYAVTVTLPRTGRTQEEYVNAPNKQIAGQTFPGETAVYGPYLTEALAEKAHPQGSGGTIPPVAGQTTPPTVNAQPSNPLGGLAAIGDFFQRLTQASTWARVGEVALGGILIYAGVRALSSGSTTVGAGARKSATRPVTKVATKAAKVAAPELRLAGRVAAKRVAPKTTARVSAHRTHVAKYGAKKPYRPPTPRPSVPRVSQTTRTSHIYHHKATP
jgi:hypothetical protein